MQTSASDLITKQCKKLLENKQQAILYAVILSILPFASWLSVALVGLVTLRKGYKRGLEVMLPAFVSHSIPLVLLIPLNSAVINSLFVYIPCYLAALCLRKTTSWQIVSGAFLIQALIGLLLIQLVTPDFVIEQFEQFKKIVASLQVPHLSFEEYVNEANSFIIAQLFFGIHILSVIISALFSLLCARFIQAKLFNPDGYKEELLKFRSDKLSLLILITTLIAVYYKIAIAINLLPLILCYFLISGFSLVYYILGRKNHFGVFTLLVVIILCKPFFVLSTYIVIGSLDSLFNFRLYLPARAKESI